jgi:hypothetical protein
MFFIRDVALNVRETATSLEHERTFNVFQVFSYEFFRLPGAFTCKRFVVAFVEEIYFVVTTQTRF